VKDDRGAWGTAATVVAAGGNVATTMTARAGGPYSGTVGQPVTFDGSMSSVPSGATAQYGWSFGDQIVITSASLRATGTRWRAVADASAASGTAFENADAAEPKVAAALAAPASYVEATFR